MIFCFETENTMTYMAYFSLASFFLLFFFRLLCRRLELKNEFCISYSRILFQQLTTGQLCYWLLNIDSGDMVKGNKVSLVFRFLTCQPTRGPFNIFCFIEAKIQGYH